MNEQQTKPCAHVPCTCRVGPEQDYCGESCRLAAESQSGTSGCECGHAACGRLE
jgi:hypothetical protein